MTVDPDFLAAEYEANRPSVPVVSWEEFRAKFAWNQGEHVAMIGPTGSGKTSLAEAILPMRKYVVIIATKPRDKVLKSWAKTMRFVVWEKWKVNVSPASAPRRMVWPNARHIDAEKTQRTVFQDVFTRVYTMGSWTVYVDELWWIAHHLGMERIVKVYLQQGRSLGLSFVAATQRPSWVPLEVYDQSTHLFFWHDNDRRNLDRISGIASFDADSVRLAIQSLDRYEVLYVNTRERYMMRTKPPAPKAG